MSNWLRLVAAIEMIGGATGAIGTLYWLINAPTRAVGPLLVSLLFIGLFAMSFLAGFYLWKGERRGIILSRWVQGLQIIHLWIGTFSFTLRSGLMIALAGGSFGFNAELFTVGSAWNLGLYNANIAFNLMSIRVGQSEVTDPESVFAAGVNIVAVVIIIYLFRQRSIPVGPTETERALRKWLHRRQG